MSDSTKLRQTHTISVADKKSIIHTDRSTKQDSAVRAGSKRVLEMLKTAYPDKTFGFQQRIMINSYRNCGSKKTFINPDGGFIYQLVDGQRVYLLITESKHQGTNDQRKKEGKPKQPYGNAIERVFKNIEESRYLLTNQISFPFVIFWAGPDTQTTLTDRVGSSCNNRFNQDNSLIRNHFLNGTVLTLSSLYVRETPWTTDEVVEIAFAIAEKSVV